MTARSTPISIRLSMEAVKELNKIAENKHLPMRTMLRAWVLDRKEIEELIVK